MVLQLLLLSGLLDTIPGRASGPVQRPTALILGGAPAAPNSIPFQVSLQVLINGVWNHFCGGVVYDAETVITAAHCAVFPSEKIRAVAGEHDLEVDEGPEQVRSVTEQRRHPFYFHLIMPFNDIALFRLAESLQLNAQVATVRLATGTPVRNKLLRTSGWGLTSNGENSTDASVLNQVAVPVLSDAQCWRRWFFFAPWTMACTAADQGGDAGPCNGDSGGPLFDAASATLYGVTSYGSRSCGARPGVYTEVAAYGTWIRRNAFGFRP